MMLHTKYQSSMPSGFRQDEFKSCPLQKSNLACVSPESKFQEVSKFWFMLEVLMLVFGRYMLVQI